MASLRFALGVASAALLCGQQILSADSLQFVKVNEALHPTLAAKGSIDRRSPELAPGDRQGSSNHDASPSYIGEDELVRPRSNWGKSDLETDFGGQAAEHTPNGQRRGVQHSSAMEVRAHTTPSFIKNDFAEENEEDPDTLFVSDDAVVGEEEPSGEHSQLGPANRISQRAAEMRERLEKSRLDLRENHKLSQNIDELGRDRSWIGEQTGGPASDDPVVRHGLSILNDDEIYSQAVDTIPGIGFLGSGYDMVMGNPLGDEHIPGDPGFKAPIIAFEWGHDKEGVSPDLTTLQPKGGYIRPYVSCQRAEKVEEIENLREYVADLAADASVDAPLPYMPFSGSFNFRRLADESSRKQTKTFMLRAYCFRYEAGLAAVGRTTSSTTDAFRKAVEKLPATFPSTLEHSSCTPQIFKQNPQSPECADQSILKWMEFFADFGTHVTTNVKLGGKVTKQLRVSKEQAQDLHNKTMRGSTSAELAFKAILAAGSSAGRDSTKNNASNSFATSSATYAVGGRAPKDPSDPQELAEWAKSVAVLPMPVKYELQPLTRLLPEHLHAAYRSAAAFYAKAFGITREDLDALTGPSETIKDILQDTTAVAWAGATPGFVDCPAGKKILFGFAAHMNMDTVGASFAISPCQIGSTRCEGPRANHSPQSDTRIWAVCGKKTLDSLETFSSVDPMPGATIGCSEDKEILFGMQMSFSFDKAGLANVNVAHCSPGAKECRFQDMGVSPGETKSRHLFFAACVDSRLSGLNNIFATSSAGIVGMSQSVDASKTAATDCGANASHVTGFALEVHTLMPLVREAINTCQEASRYCALKKYILPPPVEVEKLWRKTSKNLMHSSVAFALCALKNTSDTDAGQATLPSQAAINQHTSGASSFKSSPTGAASATAGQREKRTTLASRRTAYEQRARLP